MLTQVQIEKIVFNLRLGKVAQRMSLNNDVVMSSGTTSQVKVWEKFEF